MDVDHEAQANKNTATKELEKYGPWTLVHNKRSPRNNWNKQRQANMRINDYKKNQPPKVTVQSSLTTPISNTSKGMDDNQVLRGGNKPDLISPCKSSIEGGVLSTIDKDGDQYAVHLANPFQQLVDDDDSSSTFLNSQYISTEKLIQDNTSTPQLTNPLSSHSPSILFREDNQLHQINGESEKHKTTCMETKPNHKYNSRRNNRNWIQKGARHFSQQHESAPDGRNQAISLSNYTGSDVEFVSNPIIDDCMQDAKRDGGDWSGIQECGDVGVRL